MKNKTPTILLDFYDWEITLREVVFSIFIVGVMTFVGFLISSRISKFVSDDTLIYRQAVALNNESEFKHAINTDVGHVFVRGGLKALLPVSNKHLKDQKFLSVRVNHEEYRCHTYHYTTTDSKGRVHHHTGHYWSWDIISNEEHHSPTVEYCGMKFSYGKFSYSRIHSNSSIHNTGFRRRDVVFTKPIEFNATVFCNLKNNDIVGDGVTLESNLGIEEYRESLCNSYCVIVFWILWVIFTCVIVIMFYHIENNWLDD